MISKKMIAAMVMPFVLLAQDQKVDFSKNLKESGWTYNKERATVTLENGELKAVVIKSSPSLSHFFRYKADTPYRYAQIQFSNFSQGNILLTSYHVGSMQDWMKSREGLFTFPVYDIMKPKKNVKDYAFTIYFQGPIGLKSFAFIDRNGENGVFFTLKGADGNVKPADAVAVAGDTLVVEMPASKAEKFELAFFRIDESKNWSVKANWRPLTLPGAPAELKVSATNPKMYSAEIKLAPVEKGLKTSRCMLIAAVNGKFYGICPNSFDLASK